MPKGYVILTEEVKDPEGMKAYGRAAGAAMGNVKILAVDAKPQVLEGTWHGHQTVRAGVRLRARTPGPGTTPRPTRNRAGTPAGCRGDQRGDSAARAAALIRHDKATVSSASVAAMTSSALTPGASSEAPECRP